MKKTIFILLVIFNVATGYSQKHLTLVYSGANENVIEAIKKANEILKNRNFYDEIRKVSKFDNSKLTGNQIAERMEKATQTIQIKRRIKPIANAGTTTSDAIKISRSLFGKDSTGAFVLSVAVNTLIHETVHAVDFLNTGDEFTHNGNSPKGQENTAPWIIGAIAENMVKDKH